MGVTLSTGIFSGLDTAQIISDLMAVERRPVERYNQQRSEYEAKLSAWGKISSLLSSLESSLSSFESSSLGGMTASSSDETVFTATASSSAEAGSYRIRVSRLATAQRLYSGRFDLSTSDVADLSTHSTQTLRIQVGDNEATDISVTSTNNTLSGLRDAINDADAGVTASIVYDGTGYRLTLSAEETGASNRIVVSVDEDNDGVFGETGDEVDATGLSRLAFNPTYDADGNASGGAVVSSPLTGSSVTGNALASGELILNDVSVGASSASDDTVSSIDNAASAIAKAAAINAGTASHGVTATVNATSVTGGTPSEFSAINAGDLKINGVDVGAVAAGTDAASQGANVAAAIQAISGSTGVTASADASGNITLTASDGRNIQIQMAGTADSNTTGLSAGVSYASLTLTASSTIEIGGTAPDNAGLPSAMIQSEAAVDAELVVDGLTVNRSSNSIDDLITGVTLSLVETSSSEETLTIALDDSAVTDALNDFVSAYNGVMGMVSSLSVVVDDQAVLLTGDATARSLRTTLKSAVITDFEGQSLAALGLSHDRDGTLTLDTSILSERMEEDRDGVIDTLSALAEWLEESLEDYLETIIPARTDGLNAAIDRIDESIESLEERLALREESLVKKFSLLEQTLGQLQQQGDFLTQQLSALSGLHKSS